MKDFLGTTPIGGLLFLVPLVVLVRCMGVGSRRALQGTDLTLPRED